MSWIDGLYIGILVILLVLSALYSASDMSYSSVNILRLEKSSFLGDNRSKKAYVLAKDYDNTIATILFGNDFVNILASSLASVLGGDLLNKALGESLAATVSSLILVTVLLIFGEILPKTFASLDTYKGSRMLYPFVKGSMYAFYPFVKGASFIARLLSSPIIEKAPVETPLASDEELEAMVEAIKKDGIIDNDQRELLHRSIDFKETSCYEIMTPRVKVFAYDIEQPFAEFLKQKDVFKHSRIPVYKGNMDHILGYFQAKSLLRVLVLGGKPNIDELILPIISVPRTMEISSAMGLMKESHNHIAVVRDEFGGTEGIVTLEDVLEELVGEMWDEEDSVSLDINKTAKRNVYNVSGAMNIDKFFSFFSLDDDYIEEDYSTLSGWINDKMGRFAKVGDHLRYGKVDIVVKKVGEYSTISAEVTYHPRRKAIIKNE